MKLSRSHLSVQDFPGSSSPGHSKGAKRHETHRHPAGHKLKQRSPQWAAALPSAEPSGSDSQPVGGIRRTGTMFLAGLMAGFQSKPAACATLAGAALGCGVGLAMNSRSRQIPAQPPGADSLAQAKFNAQSRLVFLQPHQQNLPSEGIELLVVDSDSKVDGHGWRVSYVANAHIDKNLNIKTLLLKDGINKQVCEQLDQLKQISQMENPPEVLSMSLGSVPAGFLKHELAELLPELTELYGVDAVAQLPHDVLLILKDHMQIKAQHYTDNLSAFLHCGDGSAIQTKRADTFSALTNAGVTVVLSAGNEGDVEEMLQAFGLNAPKDFFRSSVFSHGEVLPAGVIVVGGSEFQADGRSAAAAYSTPNLAVDVVADSNNIKVNAQGSTSFGTSFATPKVAALAANILAINPQLKPADVEQIIVSTATKIDGQQDRIGAGKVNPQKALQAAKATL